MMYGIIFVFGLIVGSFINAVLYRLPLNRSSLRGRSFCPHCKHTLATMDLVPVISFIGLRGKCRYCRKPISWQYPLLELTTAIVFLISYLRLVSLYSFGPTLMGYFIFYAVILGYLIVIFMYDLRHYLILDKVLIPAAIIAVIANVLLGVSWVSMLIGAIFGGGVFWIQYVLSRGRAIGGGDIRLGVLMGLLLSWPNVLVAIFVAYMAGLVVGVPLLIMGAKKLSSKIPFGTFLAVGTYVALLWGKDLLQWYLTAAGL